MVNFAEYPCLVIGYRVVFYGLVSKLLLQTIDDFDFLKVEDNPAASTAWYIFNLIGLHSDLNLMELGNERDHKMKTRLCPGI
jgi:hypothetical protein